MVNPLDTSGDFAMTGNFSEDDIQHLLGVMNETHHHHHHTEETATTISSGVPNPVAAPVPAMEAVTETAAAACLQPSAEPIAPRSNGVSNGSNGNHTEIDEETKALARSERKRSREKQRRLDVNKQFSDLTKLVCQIEQEEREEDPTIFRQSFSATNRADLIARTIAHIERLRDSNKRKRAECMNLQQQLQESQKAGEEIASKYKEALCKNQGMMMPQQNKQVMMMVPMMMPNGGGSMPQFGGMQAAPSMNAPGMNQFMMPQPFMQAAAPAAPAAAPAQAPPQAPAQQPQASQQQQTPVPILTPQQMMISSMQSVFPNMVDPNATNAAMAVAGQASQPMQFMNFPGMIPASTTQVMAAAPTAAAAPDANAAEEAQQQQQQGQNGQGNSSGSGSNYAHCA